MWQTDGQTDRQTDGRTDWTIHRAAWSQLKNTMQISSTEMQFLCKILQLYIFKNKANLSDLIAATSLVISNWIQTINFSARVTLEFDWWPRKTIGHFFYTMSSFLHHFKSISEFKLELQSGNTQLGSKLQYFVLCDLEIWWMTLNKANLRDLIAATGLVILLKLDSNRRFFARMTLKFDGWPEK